MAFSLSSKLQHVINLAKWIPQAKTLDTVDSPYLVDFIKAVIRNDHQPTHETRAIEAIRQKLLSNHTVIDNVDFGSGSTIYQGERTMAQIAKSSLSNPTKCQLLARLSSFYQPTSILELGSCLGISGYYLSSASKNASIISIEGHPQYHTTCISNQPTWANNLEFRLGEFKNELEKLSSERKTYDLIFIDGSHSASAQEQLWPLYKSLSHSETVFILDDIYWSVDMQNWWKDKKQSSDFNIAIDLYHFGILTNESAIKEAIDVKIFPKKWRWQLGVKR